MKGRSSLAVYVNSNDSTDESAWALSNPVAAKGVEQVESGELQFSFFAHSFRRNKWLCSQGSCKRTTALAFYTVDDASCRSNSKVGIGTLPMVEYISESQSSEQIVEAERTEEACAKSDGQLTP